MMTTNKLIILDRDGVINQDSDAYVKSAEEWLPLPGSIEAIARLSKAGYQVAIATNQSGIARGYFDLATLQAMHHKMLELVEEQGGQISHIAFCPHGPDELCDCRKPKAGLMHQIATALHCELDTSVVVIGDSIRDLEAGINASCDIALVKTGKGLKSFEKLNRHSNPLIRDVAVYNDLSGFVSQLLLKEKLHVPT